jgi:hypothetical protein
MKRFIRIQFILISLTMIAYCNEWGVCVGVNNSFFKPSDYNKELSFQKATVLSPIEIYNSVAIAKCIHLDICLEYIDRTISHSINSVSQDQNNPSNFIDEGTVPFERRLNYLSLNLLPEYHLLFNKTSVFFQVGLGFDFYLNEYLNEFGQKKIFRSDATHPLGLSFIYGNGFTYSFGKYSIGTLILLSRSLTKIIKEISTDQFFLTISPTLLFSVEL